MGIRRFFFAALLVSLALSGAAARAQAALPATDVLYRLAPDSGFEEGCFDPCLCPVHFTGGLAGTFRLTPGPPDPWYRVFEVREVSWFVPEMGYFVTGSGTYRVGGDFALTQELSLDLKVADRAVAHYDSGVVPGGSGFPAINLPVSMNNLVCHDTLFRVSALPVAPAEIVPYSLFGSTYQEGCFGPCDCATVAKPLLGRFGLLKIGGDKTRTDFAVVGISWLVRDPAAAAGGTPVTGTGIYRVEYTPKDARLLLSLVEGGAGPARFDSGTVPWNGNLRRVDADAAENGFACYDRVYSVHARRRNAAPFDFQVVGPEPFNPGVEPAP